MNYQQLFRPPRYKIVRDGHPTHPFMVLKNGQPMAKRFNEAEEAENYAWEDLVAHQRSSASSP